MTTKTRLRGLGWDDRWKGRGVRRGAARGGSVFTGFVAGINAMWALPKNRKGRRR
jgi:hypothetical protein